MHVRAAGSLVIAGALILGMASCSSVTPPVVSMRGVPSELCASDGPRRNTIVVGGNFVVDDAAEGLRIVRIELKDPDGIELVDATITHLDEGMTSIGGSSHGPELEADLVWQAREAIGEWVTEEGEINVLVEARRTTDPEGTSGPITVTYEDRGGTEHVASATKDLIIKEAC